MKIFNPVNWRLSHLNSLSRTILYYFLMIFLTPRPNSTNFRIIHRTVSWSKFIWTQLYRRDSKWLAARWHNHDDFTSIADKFNYPSGSLKFHASIRLQSVYKARIHAKLNPSLMECKLYSWSIDSFQLGSVRKRQYKWLCIATRITRIIDSLFHWLLATSINGAWIANSQYSVSSLEIAPRRRNFKL